MSKRVLMIFGEPGAGKSTLVRRFIADTGGLPRWLDAQTMPLVRGHFNVDHKIFLMGRYDDDSNPYPGLDRLAQNCQPNVEIFVRDTPYSVIVEGDKLSNAKFLRHLESFSQRSRLIGDVRRHGDQIPDVNEDTQLWIVFLKVSGERLGNRRRARGDDRMASFYKSRATKYANILDEFAGRVTIWANDTYEQHTMIYHNIRTFLALEPNHGH